MGDFNAHNVIWGSETTDKRGKLIENLTNNEQLIILNNGQPTHVSANGTFTTIDLALSSPSVANFFNTYVLEDSYSSDHFPLVFTCDALNQQSTRKKWQFFSKRLHMELFMQSSRKNGQSAIESNVDTKEINFTLSNGLHKEPLDQ